MHYLRLPGQRATIKHNVNENRVQHANIPRATSYLSAKRVPSNSKVATLAALALWMVRICCAMTDSTSRSMRLNSSKQAQAPAEARPLKNLPYAKQQPTSVSWVMPNHMSRGCTAVGVCQAHSTLLDLQVGKLDPVSVINPAGHSPGMFHKYRKLSQHSRTTLRCHQLSANGALMHTMAR